MKAPATGTNNIVGQPPVSQTARQQQTRFLVLFLAWVLGVSVTLYTLRGTVLLDLEHPDKATATGGLFVGLLMGMALQSLSSQLWRTGRVLFDKRFKCAATPD